MEKFLLNVLQLTIIAWVGFKILKFMLFKKKMKNKRSIAKKVWQLLTNRIHYYLDNALKKQKRVLQREAVKYPVDNVIPLRKTK